jgi:hypothetical protein
MTKAKDLLKLRNVVGISEGNDAWNDDKTVTVFVKEKLPMDKINALIKDDNSPWEEKDVIPKKVRGGLFTKKKTDVIEIGDVTTHLDRQKYRPIMGGCEISPSGSLFVGTAGAIVKMKTYNSGWRTLYLLDLYYSFLALLNKHQLVTSDKYAIITNAHVTQDDVRTPKECVIVQPGVITTGAIGRAVYTLPIVPGKNNEYDVSMVVIDETLTGVLPQNIKVGTIVGARDGVIGEAVTKYGRTTELTNGELLAKNTTINIDYGDPVGKVTFVGLDLYSAMSSKGDSGSVIVATKDNSAVSLLFAGSDTVTMGIPMVKIMNKLHFTF